MSGPEYTEARVEAACVAMWPETWRKFSDDSQAQRRGWMRKALAAANAPEPGTPPIVIPLAGIWRNGRRV